MEGLFTVIGLGVFGALIVLGFIGFGLIIHAIVTED